MPSLITENVSTESPVEMVDLTERIEQLVKDSKVNDGYAIVYVPHTTAAVTINEHADPDVQHDMLRKLSEMIPRRENYYLHNEGNSDAHVKTSLVGNSVIVLIDRGRLVLGRWQGIFLCEFDGPRQRNFHVKIFSAEK